MRFNTLFGIVVGIIAILFAFYIEGGDFSKLLLPAPLLIVIGGTLMAGLASSSWRIFGRLFKLIRLSIYPPETDTKKLLFQILEFSVISRRVGMLDVENHLVDVDNRYLRKLLQLLIDAVDTETMDDIFAMDCDSLTARHREYISFFHKLGGLSPTMGIIGTVMGLISTMGAAGNDGDANKLIVSISVAFLATLWGIALANLVWIPIGDKLQTLHNAEMETMEVMYNGVRAISMGENPIIISAKLAGYYQTDEQKAFSDEAKIFINSIHRRIIQEEKLNKAK